MTPAPRRLLLAAVAVALVAAACAQAAPSAPRSSPLSAAPSATPSAAPSPTPTPIVTTAPTPSPAPSRAPASACVVDPQTGNLPSDRFTDIKVTTDATADRLTFVFGNASLEGPAGPPKGSLQVAKAPYTHGASGAAIEMTGDHVLQVRFSGMSLSNDVGQETYTGPAEVTPDLAALRHAVMYDATEGIVGWYVGYDGPGCVTLTRSGNDVTLTIDHP